MVLENGSGHKEVSDATNRSEPRVDSADPLADYRIAALPPSPSDNSGGDNSLGQVVPPATIEDGFIQFEANPPFEIAQRPDSRSSRLGFEIPADPNSLVPNPERRRQLDEYARALIGQVTGEERLETRFDGVGLPYDVTVRNYDMTYREYGQLLNRIDQRRDLSEAEKVYAWTRLNNGAGNLYRPTTEGANPDVIDSIMPWDTGHAILTGGINDRYHVPLANLTEREAREAITQHEREEGSRHGVLGRTARWALGVVTGTGEINRGDFNASVHQVAALRALKNGGFTGYAREWNARFVQR